MDNPVIGTLKENLEHIKIIFQDTIPPFTNDRGNTGDSKEYTVQAFLESYFPSDFRMKKGSIYSKTAYSNNIDCVILAPNHPILTTPKRSIILAEGVYAAVEVKPDISNKIELNRALDQIRSVKQLDRKTFVPNISNITGKRPQPEYRKKIPGVIFSQKALEPAEFQRHILKRIQSGELTYFDLPDIIISLENGLYVFSPEISLLPHGKWLLENRKEYTERTILYFDIKDQPTLLAYFLSYLFALPSPIMLNQSFLLEDYLQSYLQSIPPFNLLGLSLEPLVLIENMKASGKISQEKYEEMLAKARAEFDFNS